MQTEPEPIVLRRLRLWRYCPNCQALCQFIMGSWTYHCPSCGADWEPCADDCLPSS